MGRGVGAGPLHTVPELCPNKPPTSSKAKLLHFPVFPHAGPHGDLPPASLLRRAKCARCETKTPSRSPGAPSQLLCVTLDCGQGPALVELLGPYTDKPLMPSVAEERFLLLVTSKAGLVTAGGLSVRQLCVRTTGNRAQERGGRRQQMCEKPAGVCQGDAHSASCHHPPPPVPRRPGPLQVRRLTVETTSSTSAQIFHLEKTDGTWKPPWPQARPQRSWKETAAPSAPPQTLQPKQ